MVRHTLIIFHRLRNPLPPLFPRAAAAELEETLRAFSEMRGLPLSRLEAAMIVWGKRLWPYRRAFADLLAAYEDRLGHRFVRAQLPAALAERYREFEEHGGRFRDAVMGPPKPFFSHEDHHSLRDAAMLAWRELRQHAVQGALSVDKGRYLRLIEKHGDALREMERMLSQLELLAAREASRFPDIAEEIRSFVSGVNHGLCALGPAYSLSTVRGAREHFLGRKQEKKFSN